MASVVEATSDNRNPFAGQSKKNCQRLADRPQTDDVNVFHIRMHCLVTVSVRYKIEERNAEITDAVLLFSTITVSNQKPVSIKKAGWSHYLPE